MPKVKNRGDRAPQLPPKEKIDNTDLLKKAQCKIFHNKERRSTFAFKVEDGKVLFAEAKCHKNDTFSKKIGTKIAATKLLMDEDVRWVNVSFAAPVILSQEFLLPPRNVKVKTNA